MRGALVSLVERIQAEIREAQDAQVIRQQAAQLRSAASRNFFLPFPHLGGAYERARLEDTNLRPDTFARGVREGRFHVQLPGLDPERQGEIQREVAEGFAPEGGPFPPGQARNIGAQAATQFQQDAQGQEQEILQIRDALDSHNASLGRFDTPLQPQELMQLQQQGVFRKLAEQARLEPELARIEVAGEGDRPGAFRELSVARLGGVARATRLGTPENEPFIRAGEFIKAFGGNEELGIKKDDSFKDRIKDLPQDLVGELIEFERAEADLFAPVTRPIGEFAGRAVAHQIAPGDEAVAERSAGIGGAISKELLLLTNAIPIPILDPLVAKAVGLAARAGTRVAPEALRAAAQKAFRIGEQEAGNALLDAARGAPLEPQAVTAQRPPQPSRPLSRQVEAEAELRSARDFAPALERQQQRLDEVTGARQAPPPQAAVPEQAVTGEAPPAETGRAAPLNPAVTQTRDNITATERRVVAAMEAGDGEGADVARQQLDTLHAAEKQAQHTESLDAINDSMDDILKRLEGTCNEIG